MPVDYLGVIALRDQYDGNPIFIQKFRYGFKILREELVRGIVKTAFTRAAGAAAKAMVAEEKEQAKLEAEAKKAIGKAFKRQATPEEIEA